MRRFALSVLAAIPLLAAGPALADAPAVPTSEAGATALAEHLQDRIDALLELLADGAQLQGRHRLAVAAGEGGYRLSLSAAGLLIPDRLSARLGPTQALLVPRADGWLTGEWALPSDIALTAPGRTGGSPRRLRLSLGAHSLAVTYAPELAAVMALDGRIEDLRLEAQHHPAFRRAGLVTVSRQSQARGDGRWDVTTLLRAEEGEAEHPRDATVRFAASELQAVLSGVDYQRWGVLEGEVRARLAAGDAAAGTAGRGGETGNAGEEARRGRGARLLQALAPLAVDGWGLFDGASLSYRVEDLAVIDHEISPDGAPITLERLGLTLGVTGLTRERSALTVGFDLGPTGAPDVPESYLPRQLVLNLSLANLPTEPLRDLIAELMGAEDRRALSALLAERLPGSPLAGEGVLTINDIRLAFPDFTLAMNGTIRAEPAALVGVVGDGYMEVGGLPELIAEMRALNMDDKMVAFLTLLQAMGTREEDAEGRTVRTYTLQATESGQVLVNNTNLLPMLERALL